MTAAKRPTPQFEEGSIDVLSCPICGGSSGRSHKNVKDWVAGNEGAWSVNFCTGDDCDALWLSPRPTAEQLPRYYLNYYTHENSRNAKGGNLKQRLWPNPYSAWQRRRRELVLPATIPVGRVLEIGCGNGKNLDILRGLGWDVEGQDIDPAAADRAGKLIGKHVQTNAVGSLSFPPESFDVVFTSHLLEHTENPAETLRHVFALLKPGGLSVNYTPNAGSFSHRVFGRHWRGLEAPRHLAILGPRSATRALGEAGFSDIKISAVGVGAGLVASASIVKGPDITGAKRAIFVLFSFAWQLVEDIVGAVRPLSRWELRAIGTKRP